jgi:hypothetical protein
VRYGQGENNEFQKHKWPYVRQVYRRAERMEGDMLKRELKKCKRAVCKGVKRRAEKETMKDSEKYICEMSVYLSYVTEA